MKKILIISGIAALGVIAMASCNKKQDWTCKCTVSTGGGSAINPEFVLQNLTKKDAEKACEAYNSTAIPGSMLSCHLQ